MRFISVGVISLATATSAGLLRRTEASSDETEYFSLKIVSSDARYSNQYIASYFVGGSNIWIATVEDKPYPHFSYLAQNGELLVNDKFSLSTLSTRRIDQKTDPIYFVPDQDGRPGFQTEVLVDWTQGTDKDMFPDNVIGGNMTLGRGEQNWFICNNTRTLTWQQTQAAATMVALNWAPSGDAGDKRCDKVGLLLERA